MKKTSTILQAIVAVIVFLGASVSAVEVTIIPNGPGFKTNLSPFGGSDNWDVVTSNDGDTSYVYTTEAGYNLDLYTLSDVGLTGIINSVTVHMRARSVDTDGTQAAARIGIRTEGATFTGSTNETLTTSYTDFYETYNTNPQTLIGWTWAEVNALEAGISMRRSGTTGSGQNQEDIESRCTQVWVVIDYTPSDMVCETAFAYGEPNETCFSEYDFSNWGWTNGPLEQGEYEFEIWAAAGQCDLSKGLLVGVLSVMYDSGTATVEYIMDPGFELQEVHLYVGTNPLPLNNQGEYTVAPGLYPYAGDGSEPFEISGLSGDIYIVAHAVVCWYE